MVAYSISAALESKLFDHVVVSSTSGTVGDIAIEAGAEYHERPVRLASNDTTMYAAVHDVLAARYYADKVELFDSICMIYACAPFLTAERLCEGHEYLSKGFEFVFPVVRSAPVERALYEDSHGMQPRLPYEFSMDSRLYPPAFHPAEGWWWATCAAFAAHGGWWGDRNKGVRVPEAELQVIDTEEDWADAERRYKAMEGLMNGKED